MRRWLIGVVVAVGALTLCVSAVAASKTQYTSGKRGKAPYVSLTVAGGKVTTVRWWVKEDCGYTDHGTTHLNARIKRDGRFNGRINHSVPGWLGGSTWGQHIWGRVKGSTVTVTVDDYSSGQSQSICDGQHTFHARRA